MSYAAESKSSAASIKTRKYELKSKWGKILSSKDEAKSQARKMSQNPKQQMSQNPKQEIGVKLQSSKWVKISQCLFAVSKTTEETVHSLERLRYDYA